MGYFGRLVSGVQMEKEGTYVFNERTLVLEGVTLAEVVEFVVEVLVDLAGGAVLDEEAAEDSETTHPEDLAVVELDQQYP